MTKCYYCILSFTIFLQCFTITFTLAQTNYNFYEDWDDTVDTTVDPCDDFYTFSCRRYNISKNMNYYQNYVYKLKDVIISELPNDAPHSAHLLQQYYNSCVKTFYEPISDDSILQNQVEKFKKFTNFRLPLIDNVNVSSIPSSELLGQMIAYANMELQIPLLFSIKFSYNLKNISNGLTLYISPIYTEKIMDKEQMVDIMYDYFEYYHKEVFNSIKYKIRAEAEAMEKLEKYFHNKFVKGKIPVNQNNYTQLYPSFTLKEYENKNYPIDIIAMVKEVIRLYPNTNYLLEDNYPFYNGRGEFPITKTLQIFANILKKTNLTVNNFYNYLYFKIYSAKNGDVLFLKNADLRKLTAGGTKEEGICLGYSTLLFPETSRYLYVNAVYLQQEIVLKNETLATLTKGVINGFRSIMQDSIFLSQKDIKVIRFILSQHNLQSIF